MYFSMLLMALCMFFREQFSQMTGEEKVRSVSKNMEQMIDEVCRPVFLPDVH